MDLATLPRTHQLELGVLRNHREPFLLAVPWAFINIRFTAASDPAGTHRFGVPALFTLKVLGWQPCVFILGFVC